MRVERQTVRIGLREIPQPSALGGDWRRFWNLLWLSAVSEFNRRYAGSALGYLWTLLRPLMLFAVLYVVIATILGRFAEIPHYPIILLLGIVLFQFFSDATGTSIRSMTARADLVRKVQFPRVVVPLTNVLVSAFTLATNLVVVFVWILAYGLEPMWTWLLLPVLLLPLVILVSGAALLVSALSVRLRDMAQGWPVFTRALFYASPVLFPIEVIPQGILRDAESLNPLAPILVQARVWIIDPQAPGWFEAADGALAAIAPFLVFTTLCALGWAVFIGQARNAAEEL